MHNDGISVVRIRERYSSRLVAATSALEGLIERNMRHICSRATIRQSMLGLNELWRHRENVGNVDTK